MGKHSMVGFNRMKEIQKLSRRIMSNASFINDDDIKVLEHLANKGDFEEKKAVLLTYNIEKWSPNPNLPHDFNDLIDCISPNHKVKELFKKATPNDSVPFVDEVEEFNELMGKGWQNRKTPTINLDDAQFVIDFIQEELDELQDSVDEGDIVHVFDALLDITYVGLGNGALVFGLKDKMLAGYAEVQASNMSKACKTEKEAIDTVKLRSDQQGEPCHYELNEYHGVYVVYRTRDMKVMKSINYFSPNLEQFFTKEELDELR